jgi:tetratricopeptide (TPR) repeat protein
MQAVTFIGVCLLGMVASASGADTCNVGTTQSGRDFHTETGARVFGVPREELTPEHRRRAKAVNFGIVYGQQAFGLSEVLQIPRGEAQEMIDRYFAAYPGVRAFLDEVRPMLHPKTAEDYHQRGLRYLSKGRWYEAIADFTETLKRPSPAGARTEVLLNRARAYAGRASRANTRDDIEKGIRDLTESLLARPGDPERLILRGELFLRTGDSFSARADFEDAVRFTHVELLQHARLELGLPHPLAFPKGYLQVGEGKRPMLRRNELLARHDIEQIEHVLIQHLPGADLLLDHVGARLL